MNESIQEPEPVYPVGQHGGWVKNPAEVWRICRLIEQGGQRAMFADAAPSLLQADDDKDVFFWQAEQKILGKILGSWNQGQVGSCVSFGFGRAVQDLMLWEIACGEAEQWPGSEVATEPIYAGSRVEVGGGGISGDGSIGAWAAKWIKDWGILLRQQYGEYDLREYNEQRCRDWGYRGCPDALEPIARQHPVTAVAMVRTAEEGWAAIGAGKPVPICSNQGFTTVLREGFCEPSGTWNHCMALRARFTHPTRGKCFVIQNSWGGYLSGVNRIDTTQSGQVTLPEGCFATTWNVVDRILRQEDSFALAGLSGWARQRLTWNPLG